MQTTGTEQTQAAIAQATSDISYRAHQIAKVVDRLKPGIYRILLIKDDIDAKDWEVTVNKEETVHKFKFPRRTYAAE